MAEKRAIQLSRKKKLLFAAIPFLVLVLIFAAIEIVMRLRGYERIPDSPYRTSKYEMEWELRPNRDIIYANGVHVLVNSHGFRDDEFPTKKPDNEYRILFLGDSVIFGYFVEQNQTVPYYLEKLLNEKSSGKHYQVINTGAEGYNLYSNYWQLKRKGLELQPDFIFVSFVLNDIYEPYLNMRAYDGASWGDSGQTIGDIKEFLRKSVIFSQLELMSLKNTAQSNSATKQDYIVNNMFEDPYRPSIQSAWDKAMENLKNIYDLANENHIPLMVVVFPNRYQFDHGLNSLRPKVTLLNFTDAQKIGVVDLLPDMLADPKYTKPEDFLLDEFHLTPLGGEKAAEILEKAFRDANLETATPDDVYTRLGPWREKIGTYIEEHSSELTSKKAQ